MKLSINVNENCRVCLTAEGAKIWNASGAKTKRSEGDRIYRLSITKYILNFSTTKQESQ